MKPLHKTKSASEHEVDLIPDEQPWIPKTSARISPIKEEAGEEDEEAQVAGKEDDKRREPTAMKKPNHKEECNDESVHECALAMEKLEDRDALKRLVALMELGRLAPKGDKKIVEGVCEAVQDMDARVRREALITLAALADRGDTRVLITARKKILLDQHGSVRAAAVKAVHNLIDPGDSHSIDAIARCLEDKDRRVRDSAAAALHQLVYQNDTAAIEAVRLRLVHQSLTVRQLAKEIMAKIG